MVNVQDATAGIQAAGSTAALFSQWLVSEGTLWAERINTTTARATGAVVNGQARARGETHVLSSGSVAKFTVELVSLNSSTTKARS